MSYLKMFEYGKVRIKIYGGLNEIGGNCVVVEDRDRKIVFDNGIRFSLLRKFYGGRIEPLGLSELRSLGVIPPLDALERALSLYVSHFHLDHVGLLGSVPPNLSVIVPSVRVFENTLATWYKTSGSWLAYVLPDFAAKIEEVKPKTEDENRVMAVPVSHSCFPAYSFLYFGDDVTIFYSGDLRVEPLSEVSHRLDEVIKEAGIDRVDVAIVEGTNFSEVHTLLTASAFRDYLLILLREYGFVSISIDPLDLETLMLVLDLSLMVERSLVIGSERLLWAIEEVEKVRPGTLDKVYFSEELETLVPLPLKSISLTKEVFRSPESYLLVIEPAGLLQLLRKLKIWGEVPNLASSVVVLTDPEPRESIKEVEERVLRTWLRGFGAQTLRLRLSGHYLPHQFRNIVEALRPKELIPVHTEETSLMRKLFQRFAEGK